MSDRYDIEKAARDVAGSKGSYDTNKAAQDIVKSSQKQQNPR